jgi:hypothetical protein
MLDGLSQKAEQADAFVHPPVVFEDRFSAESAGADGLSDDEEAMPLFSDRV